MWPWTEMGRIVGHRRVVEMLKRSWEAGRLSHAYLFLGPEGVGKKTLALHLAQMVNCAGDDPPCQDCPSCQRIAQGKHPDVQDVREGEGRAGIGIDVIREVQRTSVLRPYQGEWRGYILDGGGQKKAED